jgi:hypothetical protein
MACQLGARSAHDDAFAPAGRPGAGAQPNVIKVAPLLGALGEEVYEAILVHTGQRYDYGMSGASLEDLERYWTWRSVTGHSGPSYGPRH